jgi:hypothetical protein
VLLQLTFTRHPDLQDVPLVFDFARTAESRAILEFFVGRQQYGRPFIAPPGTPAPVVAAYREAFVRLANDPHFRDEAAQQQATINLAPGETVARFVDRLHATPKPVLDRAIALTKAILD